MHKCINQACLQGMGEPLNNYTEVAIAVRLMIDPQIFALRRSAVTISTVGVIPRMLQMMDDLPGVSLALSLHAPTQELRRTIVPSAKAYPLDKLMAAVDKYQMHTRQKVDMSWCLRTLTSMHHSPCQAHKSFCRAALVRQTMYKHCPACSSSVYFLSRSEGIWGCRCLWSTSCWQG